MERDSGVVEEDLIELWPVSRGYRI